MLPNQFFKPLGQLPKQLVASLFITSLVGCNVEPPLQSCTSGTLSRMYLGQDTPAGAVTQVQWQRFVADVVTPSFPGGFTVINAQGQWRNADGTIKHEDTRVRALAHAYKRTFAQQSVLMSQLPAMQCS